jgi:hypothetical protein
MNGNVDIERVIQKNVTTIIGKNNITDEYDTKNNYTSNSTEKDVILEFEQIINNLQKLRRKNSDLFLIDPELFQ